MASRAALLGTLLSFAILAGGTTFLLPLATDDERAVLTLVARSVPVTTCIALKTTSPSGQRGNWAEMPRGVALEHAQANAVHGSACLPLDALSVVENLFKVTCDERVSLSTPGFAGNLAFVEQSSARMRETVALEKRAGRWNIIARDVEPLNAVIIG